MNLCGVINLFVLITTALVSQIAAECNKLQVSGTIFQKGVEGDYELYGITCTDGYPLYAQTQPAAGWGSIFYLYYRHHDDAIWNGWMFSMYRCSDMPFVRNIDRTTHPEKTSMPWEEFLDGNFVVNTDIEVKCTDGELSAAVIIVISLVGAAVLLFLALLPLFWMRYAKRKRAAQHRSRCTASSQTPPHARSSMFMQEEIPTVFRATPPPYCAQVPDFDDIGRFSNPSSPTSFRTSQPSMPLKIDAPPSYEESVLTNNQMHSSRHCTTNISDYAATATSVDTAGVHQNDSNRVQHLVLQTQYRGHENAAFSQNCAVTRPRTLKASSKPNDNGKLDPQILYEDRMPNCEETQIHEGALYCDNTNSSRQNLMIETAQQNNSIPCLIDVEPANNSALCPPRCSSNSSDVSYAVMGGSSQQIVPAHKVRRKRRKSRKRNVASDTPGEHMDANNDSSQPNDNHKVDGQVYPQILYEDRMPNCEETQTHEGAIYSQNTNTSRQNLMIETAQQNNSNPCLNDVEPANNSALCPPRCSSNSSDVSYAVMGGSSQQIVPAHKVRRKRRKSRKRNVASDTPGEHMDANNNSSCA